MPVVVYIHPASLERFPFCGKHTHRVFSLSKTENFQVKMICWRMSEDTTPSYEKEYNNENILKIRTKLKIE